MSTETTPASGRKMISFPAPTFGAIFDVVAVLALAAYIGWKEYRAYDAPDAYAAVEADARAWKAALPDAYEAVAKAGEAGAVKPDRASVGRALAAQLHAVGDKLATDEMASPNPWAALRASAKILRGK